ncbi:MAG: hypothetical protein JNK26_04420 [Candidatus Doudnabacteria bacterium]|nr:hypothetical protein [Candidatus Doudnabacteria bacterium]
MVNSSLDKLPNPIYHVSEDYLGLLSDLATEPQLDHLNRLIEYYPFHEETPEDWKTSIIPIAHKLFAVLLLTGQEFLRKITPGWIESVSKGNGLLRIALEAEYCAVVAEIYVEARDQNDEIYASVYNAHLWTSLKSLLENAELLKWDDHRESLQKLIKGCFDKVHELTGEFIDPRLIDPYDDIFRDSKVQLVDDVSPLGFFSSEKSIAVEKKWFIKDGCMIFTLKDIPGYKLILPLGGARTYTDKGEFKIRIDSSLSESKIQMERTETAYSAGESVLSQVSELLLDLPNLKKKLEASLDSLSIMSALVDTAVSYLLEKKDEVAAICNYVNSRTTSGFEGMASDSLVELANELIEKYLFGENGIIANLIVTTSGRKKLIPILNRLLDSSERTKILPSILVKKVYFYLHPFGSKVIADSTITLKDLQLSLIRYASDVNKIKVQYFFKPARVAAEILSKVDVPSLVRRADELDVDDDEGDAKFGLLYAQFDEIRKNAIEDKFNLLKEEFEFGDEDNLKCFFSEIRTLVIAGCTDFYESCERVQKRLGQRWVLFNEAVKEFQSCHPVNIQMLSIIDRLTTLLTQFVGNINGAGVKKILGGENLAIIREKLSARYAINLESDNPSPTELILALQKAATQIGGNYD